MSLADRLEQFTPLAITQCVTCHWYDKLDDADRAAFDAWAGRDDIVLAAFHKLCSEEGLECAESSFKRHLKHHEPR